MRFTLFKFLSPFSEPLLILFTQAHRNVTLTQTAGRPKKNGCKHSAPTLKIWCCHFNLHEMSSANYYAMAISISTIHLIGIPIWYDDKYRRNERNEPKSWTFQFMHFWFQRLKINLADMSETTSQTGPQIFNNNDTWMQRI